MNGRRLAVGGLCALLVLAWWAGTAPAGGEASLRSARASPSGAPAGLPAASVWEPYDRAAQYAVVKEADVPIPMRDGTVLKADVYRPKAPGRFPVLLTQTPYRKDVVGGHLYFVERGYVHVVVDVRGTGKSQGTWEAFGEAEQRDGYELVEWAARQPWSDGNIGGWGASYAAANQLLTAAQQPPHLRAIFPIAPMADGYRDIAMTGGAADLSFIPLWLGLMLGDSSGGPAPMPVVAWTRVLLGEDVAYDGPFWRLRSPIEVADRIRVPVFIVGGLHDLFQRGEPLLYERLKTRVPAKLLMGNWTHSNLGAGLPADGVPPLDRIALRWFDQYVKEMDAGADRMPSVTQYVLGRGRFEVQPDWPHPDLAVRRFYLRSGRGLDVRPPAKPEPGDRVFLSGFSGTAGAEAVYTTPALDRNLFVSGPIAAHLWVSTTGRDAVLRVKVEDVSPDGRVEELTAGRLVLSLRAVDPAKSRIVHGEMIQPWHPFTKESRLPVESGVPVPVDVEIFPTNGVIRAGHALRISISASPVPRLALPDAVASLGATVDILHDPIHPSFVRLPVLP